MTCAAPPAAGWYICARAEDRGGGRAICAIKSWHSARPTQSHAPPLAAHAPSRMLPRNMRDLTVTMRKAMHLPCSPLCSTCLCRALIHELLVRSMLDVIIVVWNDAHKNDPGYQHYSVHVPLQSLEWVKMMLGNHPCFGSRGKQSHLVNPPLVPPTPPPHCPCVAPTPLPHVLS